jgi:thymidylate synthase
MNEEEQQYLNLVRDIIDNRPLENGRNGKTIAKFGHSMRFSLADGIIPILTTKKVAFRPCFEELFWFIRGCTDNQQLQDKKVSIWNGNSTREFLDSRGLYDRAVGDLGPVYGFQWRHFNATYVDRHTDYSGKGVDQLQNIIDDLKNEDTRSSRRHILTAWNPCQLEDMALPPCHMICQFNVRAEKYLSCALFQRSGDVGLGVPFNIASYSLFTHILAKHCGLIADEFVYFLGNCHIYENHLEQMKIQIQREPMEFPKIEIKNVHENINDYCMDDIEWKTKYVSHEAIKMNMSA